MTAPTKKSPTEQSYLRGQTKKYQQQSYNEILLNWYNLETKTLYLTLSSHWSLSIPSEKRPVTWNELTLSWRRPLSYRNQSIDLQSKSMDWFLYDKCWTILLLSSVMSISFQTSILNDLYLASNIFTTDLQINQARDIKMMSAVKLKLGKMFQKLDISTLGL